MNQKQTPTWWGTQYDSSWERVKAAFRRDWDQTKHDLGGNEPDTDQNVKDTVKQAAGKEPIPPRGVPSFEQNEPAYKFGYGARQHYATQYQTWNDKLESQLRSDWETAREGKHDWDDYRSSIRRGWDYQVKGQ
ncbi:MAG: hypothetical protein U1G07_13330 [Verrucomicrobiota bacterium]